MDWKIIWNADTEGDWFDDGDEPLDERRFASAAEAEETADLLYRGPDVYGAACRFAAVPADVEPGSAAAEYALMRRYETALDKINRDGAKF